MNLDFFCFKLDSINQMNRALQIKNKYSNFILKTRFLFFALSEQLRYKNKVVYSIMFKVPLDNKFIFSYMYIRTGSEKKQNHNVFYDRLSAKILL